MGTTIRPEFEAFARQQVEAGAFASEQDAVDVALKGYLADVLDLRASLQEATVEDEAGGGVDGETFMAGLLAEARARKGARSMSAASGSLELRQSVTETPLVPA